MKKLYKILILFVVQISELHANLFPTLTSAKEYAQKNLEYPDIGVTGDWHNPDFTNFYKEQMPTWWQRALIRTGLKKPVWDIYDFKKLLEKQIRFRQMNGLHGEFIQKINPSAKNKFILWGDLHGAYHSIIRDLVDLHHKGIIDQNFRIINEDYYFIINGNSVSYSPYSLATLTLIMRLMEVNPKKVLYIRGKHEDRQKWQNYGLVHELKVKARAVSHELIPLNTELTTFFNTLPLAVYLCDVQSDKVNVVQISAIDLEDPRIVMKNYAGFLVQTPGDYPQVFKVEQKFTTEKKVELKAIISSEDRTVNYTPSKGLVVLRQIDHAPIWALLSSPIGMHRTLYNYFYDSYVQLAVTPNIDDWTLTLFSQDVRQMLGFKKMTTYNLISGDRVDQQVAQVSTIDKPGKKETKTLETDMAELEKKVATIEQQLKKVPPVEALSAQVSQVKKVKKEEKPKLFGEEKIEQEQKVRQPETKEEQKQKEYTFGSSTDLRPGSSDFFAYGRGLKLRFDQAREEGGINGVMPKLILENDYFEADKTRKIVEEFIKKGIDTILAPTGSANLKVLLDLIKAKKILMLFPSTGLPEVRSPEYEYIVHCRANDLDEGEVLASYAIKTLKVSKGVLFVEDDAFGHSLLKGVNIALKKLNAEKNWTVILHDHKEIKFDEQVAQIKKIEPDAIIFCGITTAGIELIRQIGVAKLAGTHLLANSDFSAENTVKFMQEKGLKMIYTSVMPNPKTSELEIAKQFRKAAEKANMAVDIASFEPYFYADLAFDLIKKIKGKITNQSILEVVENIKDYNYKGLILNFNPKTRKLGNFVWLNTGTDKWELVMGKTVESP